MTRRLSWIAIVALAAYLVFVGGAWSGQFSAAIRLTSLSFAALVIVVWAFVAWRQPEWRPRSVLFPAIGACLASLAISTALSTNPRVSADYLGYAMVLAALYLLLVRLMAMPFFQERLVALAKVLFVCISVGFVVLNIVHWSVWLSVLGRLTIPPLRPEYESLTFGSPQGVLTILALLAVPIAASFDWRTARGIGWVGAAILVVALVGLISGSRGAWLALAIAGGAAAAWIWLATRGRTTAVLARLPQSRGGRALLAGTLLALGIAGVALTPSVLERVSAGGETLRISYATTALRLFAEHPVVGSGPGTWVIERARLTQAGEVDDYQAHAHNIYVQTLAELGLGGAAAGVVLLASLVWLLRGGLRRSDPSARRWAAATAIGAVYFLTHQVVDFWANMPGLLFAAAIPVAYLDATSDRSMTVRRQSLPGRVGRPGLALGGAVLLGTVMWLGIQEVRAVRYDDLVRLADAGDWTTPAIGAREVASEDPMIASYAFSAGLMADRAGDYANAAAYFAAVTVRYDLPEAWLNLAAEQAKAGDRAKARTSLVSALRLGRQRPAVAMPIGDLALRIGDPMLARQAFAAAISSAPSLAADTWWSADQARLAAFDDVVASLTGPGRSQGWEIALMAGDAALATTLAAGGAGADVLDFIRAWAGDRVAADALVERCRAEPFDVSLLLWCARLEDRSGRPLAADAFRYLADAQAGESFLHGLELRVGSQPAAHQRAGNPATAWGIYTYRRVTPGDMLVPSLVHLVLV